MSQPISAWLQLPSDSGNTGKKIRTQSRVIGSDTVHEYHFTPVRRAAILGVYRLGLSQQTVSASAQNGTSTGFVWAYVPLAVSGKKVRLRAIRVESQHSTALATPTAPRLTFSRMTFTGSASGASGGTAVKVDSAFPAAIFDVRTAVTGLTVSLVGSFGLAGLCGALTAVGAYAPSSVVFGETDDEDQWPMFASGEGLVIWQDTAGTASDTRKINLTLIWDEIDVS